MPKRSKARVLALQITFQFQAQSDSFSEHVDAFVKDAGLDAGLSRYGRELAMGTWKNRSEADELIDKFARDWRASSLPAVSARIDRIALMAFDLYTECREEVGQLRINEVKRQMGWVLEKMNQRDETAGEAPAGLG